MTDTTVERVVVDPRFDRLVPPDAVAAEARRRDDLGRGSGLRPRRGRARLERYPQRPGPALVRHGWRPCSDLYHPADFANGHTLDHDGTILACEHGMRRVARYERDGPRTTVVDRYEGKRLNSPERHDRRVRRRDLVHRPALRHRQRRRGPHGRVRARSVLRLSASIARPASWRSSATTWSIPNGLAFSPDESVLYVSDTSRARHRGRQPPHPGLRRHRWRPRLGAPRVFAVIEPGVADGFRVDVEGNVWTSAGDGVHVLDSVRRRARADRCCPSRSATAPSAAPMVGGSSCATSTLWSIDVGIRGAITPWVDPHRVTFGPAQAPGLRHTSEGSARLGLLGVRRVIEHGLGLTRSPRRQSLGECIVAEREDRGRQQPGVHGVPDRHGRDRHAARHLDDRQQRIEPAEVLRRDGDADDRQRSSSRRASRADGPHRRRPRR